MFFYIWDEDPARVNFSVDQSSSCTSGTLGQYLKGTICTSGKLGGKLYHWPTWTLPELLDLIHRHDDDDQVTAPTPSLGSHGSGEGDSTYFTGERPSPHHLSVLSEFHNSTEMWKYLTQSQTPKPFAV